MSRWKSIETKHHEERDAFFRELGQLSRRSFMKVAGSAAAPSACLRNATWAFSCSRTVSA